MFIFFQIQNLLIPLDQSFLPTVKALVVGIVLRFIPEQKKMLKSSNSLTLPIARRHAKGKLKPLKCIPGSGQ